MFQETELADGTGLSKMRPTEVERAPHANDHLTQREEGEVLDRKSAISSKNTATNKRMAVSTSL